TVVHRPHPSFPTRRSSDLAFLYHILPLLMTLISCSFPHDPPMWTNTDFSSNSLSRVSVFLSDIHCHFSLERWIISCSTVMFWAKDDCAPITIKRSTRVNAFIGNIFIGFTVEYMLSG